MKKRRVLAGILILLGLLVGCGNATGNISDKAKEEITGDSVTNTQNDSREDLKEKADEPEKEIKTEDDEAEEAVNPEENPETQEDVKTEEDTKQEQETEPEETKPAAETEKHSTVEIDEATRQWIYAASAHTYEDVMAGNHCDHRYIGGYQRGVPANVTLMKNQLMGGWGIETKEDLMGSLYWLLYAGHWSGCMKYVEELLALGWDAWSIEQFDAAIAQEADAEYCNSMIAAYLSYQKLGNASILAWDYTRALRLLDRAYIAEMISLEEYITLAVPIAAELQTQFNSWEDIYLSTAYGNFYWQGSSMGTSSAAKIEWNTNAGMSRVLTRDFPKPDFKNTVLVGR